MLATLAEGMILLLNTKVHQKEAQASPFPGIQSRGQGSSRAFVALSTLI